MAVWCILGRVARRWLACGLPMIVAIGATAVDAAPRRCRVVKSGVVRTSVVVAAERGRFERLNAASVVPFAVPVAVPVATVTVPGVLYRYQAVQTAARAGADVGVSERAALPSRTGLTSGSDEVATTTSDALPEGESVEVRANRIMKQRCAACHRDGNAAGHWSLDGVTVERLDRRQRFEIIRRVTSDDETERMPQSGRLARDEIEALLEALVR